MKQRSLGVGRLLNTLLLQGRLCSRSLLLCLIRILESSCSGVLAIDEALPLHRLELSRGHFHAAVGLDRIQIDLSHEPLSSIHLLATPIKEAFLFVLRARIFCRRDGHDFLLDEAVGH